MKKTAKLFIILLLLIALIWFSILFEIYNLYSAFFITISIIILGIIGNFLLDFKVRRGEHIKLIVF